MPSNTNMAAVIDGLSQARNCRSWDEKSLFSIISKTLCPPSTEELFLAHCNLVNMLFSMFPAQMLSLEFWILNTCTCIWAAWVSPCTCIGCECLGNFWPLGGQYPFFFIGNQQQLSRQQSVKILSMIGCRICYLHVWCMSPLVALPSWHCFLISHA